MSQAIAKSLIDEVLLGFESEKMEGGEVAPLAFCSNGEVCGHELRDC